MKNILLVFALFIFVNGLFGQAPNGISFQALVRNSAGEAVKNSQIQVRLSILKGSSTGTILYSEKHTPITNSNGLFSLEIGQGTVISGQFTNVDWSDGDIYIKREIDPENDNTYPISGTSQVLTVPYSFYSNIADSVISKQQLTLSNDTIYLSDGGYVKLPSGTVDTDQQGLSAMRSGNQVTINIERGSGATFTDHVDDADADATNEIQTISKMDRTVTLSDNGGSFVDSILTEAQVDAFANNNGYLTTEMDGDSTNELQVLSISNDTIYLSDGGAVKIPGINQGDILDGSEQGEILYWNGSSWVALTKGNPGQQLIIDENGLPKWTGDAFPTVSTVSTSNISATSVTVNVNITSDGGQSVSSRGVVYGTSDNPTLSNSYQVSGSGIGSFNVTVSDPTPNTNYYVRGYGTNAVGTGYGSSLNFTTTAPTLPVLSTNAISSITQTSAVSGGVISSDGGNAITSRGVVWSTSSNPTISNNKTEDGTGTGNYSSSLTGLTDNTTYYVRSYATNSVGTAYGNELSFTTAALTVPILTTNTVVNITNTSAQSGGMITSDGGSTISAKGVVWSINSNPTLSDNSTNDGTGTAGYNSVLTGLSDGVTYYVRAYATNSSGTGYGDQKSFTSASTANTIAQLTTKSVYDLTTIRASILSEIISEGGSSIIERGIVWSNTVNPTVLNNKMVSGAGIGEYPITITSGLSGGSTYYVRAYAVNSYGIA